MLKHEVQPYLNVLRVDHKLPLICLKLICNSYILRSESNWNVLGVDYMLSSKFSFAENEIGD